MQSEPVPWGVREVVAATVAAVALVILVVGGAFGALFLLRSVIDTAPFARPVVIGAVIVYQLGFLAIALAVARRRGGPEALGFRPFPPAALATAAGLLVLGIMTQIAYGLVLQSLGLGQENPQRVDVLVGSTPLSLAVALISGAVLAPIAEEAFFRGVVLPGLASRLGTTWAVVISSAFFALGHLVPQVFVPIFVLGVFLALLRLWSRSLWPAIALHSAFNAVSLLTVFAVTQRAGAP